MFEDVRQKGAFLLHFRGLMSYKESLPDSISCREKMRQTEPSKVRLRNSRWLVAKLL